jgi:hypothetical protein
MEPTPHQEFPLVDLIACASREVGMRETCYVKWDKKSSVAELSPSRKREINMMRAIEQLLTQQAAQPTTPPTNLSELTAVAHTTEAGQQRYYKAEEVEALFAAQPARATIYPAVLTPELAEVLGWPNFKCGPLAQAFRAAGHEIATKSEAEQAFILHWLTGIVLKYGADWKPQAASELAVIKEKASQGKGADRA